MITLIWILSMLVRRGTWCVCMYFFICNQAILFFFKQKHNRTNPHFYLFSRSLNPQRVQHHMDSVSNGLRKVASEFGTSHATVSMSSSYLSPDYSGFVRFSTRSYCVVLCFVHISTSFACIEFSFISSIYTFSFQESSVFPLVPVDPVYSQQKWPWTTAFQAYLSF